MTLVHPEALWPTLCI